MTRTDYTLRNECANIIFAMVVSTITLILNGLQVSIKDCFITTKYKVASTVFVFIKFILWSSNYLFIIQNIPLWTFYKKVHFEVFLIICKIYYTYTLVRVYLSKLHTTEYWITCALWYPPS